MKRVLFSTCLLLAVASVIQTAHADIVGHAGLTDPTSEGWSPFEFTNGGGVVEGVVDSVGPTDAWHVKSSGTYDTGGGTYYTASHNAAVETLAQANGWSYSTKVRLLQPNLAIGNWATFFEADDGYRDYVLNLGTTADGDPIVQWLYGSNTGQQTLAGGAGAYHVFEIRTDPAVPGSASVYADNNLLVSGWTGMATGESYALAWGAGTRSSVCDANFAEVHFNVVPEPASTCLLMSGILGLLAYAWRRK